MTYLPLLLLAATPLLADDELPEVLIVGTFHMDVPGLDLINPDAGDVFEKTRQAEIQELVARLVRFEPTHVAVEWPALASEQLDARYSRYIDGSSEPSRGEIYQVAFPIAAESNLDRVHPIDFPQGLEMGPVIARAEEQHPAIARRFTMGMEAIGAEFDALMKRPIPEIFEVMNTPDPEKEHGFYLLAAQVGTAADPLGADMATAWYERNLKIYANIARLAESGSDRILVLIGAGHAHLLREFVKLTPNLRLADALEYLRE